MSSAVEFAQAGMGCWFTGGLNGPEKEVNFDKYFSEDIVWENNLGISAPSLKEFDSTFVTTYYLQMPNNLEGDDGYIYFKTKDEKEFGFLPKEDEIIIFPADLEHNVRLNKKSTIPRICIASNYMYFNYKDAKLNKTLF